MIRALPTALLSHAQFPFTFASPVEMKFWQFVECSWLTVVLGPHYTLPSALIQPFSVLLPPGEEIG